MRHLFILSAFIFRLASCVHKLTPGGILIASASLFKIFFSGQLGAFTGTVNIATIAIGADDYLLMAPNTIVKTIGVIHRQFLSINSDLQVKN